MDNLWYQDFSYLVINMLLSSWSDKLSVCHKSCVVCQALMAENDGLIDGPGWNSDEAQLMGECLHLLLSTLLTLISW